MSTFVSYAYSWLKLQASCSHIRPGGDVMGTLLHLLLGPHSAYMGSKVRHCLVLRALDLARIYIRLEVVGKKEMDKTATARCIDPVGSVHQLFECHSNQVLDLHCQTHRGQLDRDWYNCKIGRAHV